LYRGGGVQGGGRRAVFSLSDIERRRHLDRAQRPPRASYPAALEAIGGVIQFELRTSGQRARGIGKPAASCSERMMPSMNENTKLTSSSGTIDTGVPTVRVALPAPPRAAASPAERSARYREHGVLGRGGMGEVRLIEDVLIGREVAVKTIAADVADSHVMRE